MKYIIPVKSSLFGISSTKLNFNKITLIKRVIGIAKRLLHKIIEISKLRLSYLKNNKLNKTTPPI